MSGKGRLTMFAVSDAVRAELLAGALRASRIRNFLSGGARPAAESRRPAAQLRPAGEGSVGQPGGGSVTPGDVSASG